MLRAIYYPSPYPTAGFLKFAAICWDRLFYLGPVGDPPPAEIEEFERGIGGKLIYPLDTAGLGASSAVLISFDKWLRANAFHPNHKLHDAQSGD